MIEDVEVSSERDAHIARLVLKAALKETARLASDLDRVGKAIHRATEYLEKFDEATKKTEPAIFEVGRFTSFTSWWSYLGADLRDEALARARWLAHIEELRATGLAVIFEVSDIDGPLVVRVEQ